MAKNFNWKDLLLKHSLFLGLNLKEVERIIEQLLDDRVSEEMEYFEGKVIVREGEPGDSVFLVGSGSVQVVLEGKDGYEIPIATLQQGEFFGEMALLDKRPRAATVRARQSCTLLEIKGQEFLKLLDEHRDVESKMLLKLSERLRQANEQVLAVKVTGVDDKLERFNSKLDAQLKAVDASLKAALAVFDQTKLRTDEIISSADRSRAQRTWFFGIVATLVSIASYFGLTQIVNLKEHADKARNAMLAINEVTPQIEKIRPSIDRFELIGKSFDRSIRIIYQPEFQKALKDGTDKDINDSYSNLKELHTNYSWYLDDIELSIRDRPKRNYAPILQVILTEAQNPKDHIRAHYLLLTTAILTDSMDDFEKQFQNLKSYVDTRGPFDFKYDVSSLNKVFKDETRARQRRFNQVIKLIPTR